MKKAKKRINNDELSKEFYYKLQKARLFSLAFFISYAVSFTISGSSTI